MGSESSEEISLRAPTLFAVVQRCNVTECSSGPSGMLQRSLRAVLGAVTRVEARGGEDASAEMLLCGASPTAAGSISRDEKCASAEMHCFCASPTGTGSCCRFTRLLRAGFLRNCKHLQEKDHTFLFCLKPSAMLGSFAEEAVLFRFGGQKNRDTTGRLVSKRHY